MLYLDGFALSKLKETFEDKFLNRRVTKVYQYDKSSISLFFKQHNLFATINPSLPIIYIQEEKEDAPKKPMTFGLLLKKYLLNGTLNKIEQLGMDRILIFHFSKLNELGEIHNYKLIFEIMGKKSNIILADDNMKMMELLREFSMDENKLRTLMPGVAYEPPIITEKKYPYDVDRNFFEENINSYQDVYKNIDGFGSISAKEVYKSFEDYQEFLNREPKPTIYFKNNKIYQATFFEYKEFENLEKKSFDSMNKLINYYIEKTITNQNFNTLNRKLKKIIDKEIQKNKKIIKKITKDIQRGKNYKKYKEMGDILAANLYNIKQYQEEVTLYNFYAKEDITIKLDPSISPNQNLDNYYEKYNKKKRGYFYNKKRREEILDEIKYLESLEAHLLNADNMTELEDLKEDLIENGYMEEKKKKKNKRSKKKKKPSYLNIREVTSSDGFKILIGKNNKANDHLTFRKSKKDDLWLHAKDIPGSHVIVKKGNADKVPDQTLLEAAQLAAYYSKSKFENKVAVDYTLRKYVTSPNGSKPGFVIYTHENGITVHPKKDV
ncbi:MAG: Rqc2 family fibronectin-binding protein [Fusobacteriota bacterium]